MVTEIAGTIRRFTVDGVRFEEFYEDFFRMLIWSCHCPHVRLPPQRRYLRPVFPCQRQVDAAMNYVVRETRKR